MEKEGKANTVPNEKEIPPKRWFRKRGNRAKMGKDQFVICILAGILLIVIAVPSPEKKSRKAAEYGLLDSKSDIIEENTIKSIVKKDISRVSIIGNGIIRNIDKIKEVLNIIEDNKLDMLNFEVSESKISITFKNIIDDNILNELNKEIIE